MKFTPHRIYYRHFIFTFIYFPDIILTQFTFCPCGSTHGNHVQKCLNAFARPGGNFGAGTHG